MQNLSIPLLLGIVVLMWNPQPSVAQTTQTTNNLLSLSETSWKNPVERSYLEKGIALEEALSVLEEAFDVLFLYRSHLLNQKTISESEVLSQDRTLDDILQSLFKDSGLTFKPISDRSIGIIPENSGEPVQDPITVQGRVTDISTGETMPGVNIVVEGTQTGTSTNANGEYSLEIPSHEATLLFTFIGYQTVEEPVDGRSIINVVMEPQAYVGEELVVVGYGTTQRAHLTGSVGSVEMGELASRPVVDFGEALYGKVSGVQVQNPSGRPGESSRIQVRGLSSISAGNEPLIVVDGVVLPDFDLNILNSSDIESIDILKDASSAAIYGSRGAGGVILVTTKSGTPGDLRVSFNYRFTSQSVLDKVDVMNAAEYAQASIDAAQIGWIRSGGDPNAPNTIEARGERKYTWPEALENPETLPDVDYQDVIYRRAAMHNVDLNVSGGDDYSRYYVSVGLVNQDGIVITTDYQKYNLNIKADTKYRDWLTVGGMVNTALDYESVISNWVLVANQYPSIYPIFDDEGYLGGPHNQPGFEPWNGILFRANYGHPYHNTGVNDHRERLNITSNIFTEIELFPALKFRSSVNAFYRRQDRTFYEDSDTGLGPGILREASFLSTMNRTLSYTLENLLLYNTNWNHHNIDAVAGYEFSNREYYSITGERSGYDNDIVQFLGAGNQITGATDTANESTLISMFGRLNYNYMGRYMASISFRRDGSSRFGPENKWGNFPAFSVGWRLSDEEFMNSLDFLSELTIRVSYGFTGNDNIGNYSWISSMSQNRAAIGENLHTTFHPASVQNPDLRWERTQQINLGLNIGLFDSRVYVESDFYRSNSEDLLLQVPVPSISGFTSQLQNIGSVRNTGVELGLTSHNITTRDFHWTSNITFARNRGIVTSLGPDDAPMIFSDTNMGFINQVGEAPFSFYAYEYLGAYRNQEEIDTHGVQYTFDVHPGMGKYRDVNGDGLINAEDRTIVGNPQPDFTWSLSNSFNYRHFDFSFLIHGSVGGDVYDANWRRSMFYHEGRNYLHKANNRWRSEDDPGDGYIHALTVDVAGTLERDASSYWIMDGTYTRLKDVTLGYSPPQRYTERMGITGARFYINATNLITLQSTTTIDPENVGGGSTSSIIGVQHSPYPSAKTISLGTNLQF